MDPLPLPKDFLLPLPASPVDLQLAIVLLFLAHILFVNLMLGGALLTLFYEVRGLRRPELDRLAHRIAHTVTVNKSLAVVLGVGPLLVMNALYGLWFYTANSLTGRAWIMIVPLVITAFLLLYAGLFDGVVDEGLAPHAGRRDDLPARDGLPDGDEAVRPVGRDRVERRVPLPRRRREASHRRGIEGADLRAGQERGQDRRLRGERRRADRFAAVGQQHGDYGFSETILTFWPGAVSRWPSTMSVRGSARSSPGGTSPAHAENT